MLRDSLSSESSTVPSQTTGEVASHTGRACGCGYAIHDVARLQLLFQTIICTSTCSLLITPSCIAQASDHTACEPHMIALLCTEPLCLLGLQCFTRLSSSTSSL